MGDLAEFQVRSKETALAAELQRHLHEAVVARQQGPPFGACHELCAEGFSPPGHPAVFRDSCCDILRYYAMSYGALIGELTFTLDSATSGITEAGKVP